MRWLAAVQLVGVACGRLDFDEHALDGFVCNEPQRFQTPGAEIAALAATPTADGHLVATVDMRGNLAAWSFARRFDRLDVTASNLAIDDDVTTTLSLTSIGSKVMVAGITGVATPTGTRIWPRSSDGAERSMPVDHPEFAADTAIAVSSDGVLAFSDIDASTLAVRLRPLDVTGDYAAPPIIVVDATEKATHATIGPGGPGYVVQWTSSAATPDALKLALVDADGNLIAGPVQTNITTEGPGRPRVAWSSDTDTYLVSWFEKNATDDDVWFQLRGADLSPLTMAGILAPHAVRPEVAIDSDGFWVTWKDLQTNTLAAAHVSATGVVTPRVVTSSGGTPKQWTMLRAGGQSVLVWIEAGGSGPDLWFDPLCL